MSDSEEILSSSEEDIISETSSGEEEASSDNDASNASFKTVEESDAADGSDDVSIATRKRAGKKKRVAVIESDTDEEFEERAISPRTRMSITGVRPKDFDSDDESSEIEYSDNEPGSPKAGERYKGGNGTKLSTLLESDKERENETDVTIEVSKVYSRIDASTAVAECSTIDSSSMQDSLIAPNQHQQNKDLNLSPRVSLHFANDISDKLSSTHIVSDPPPVSFEESSDDSSDVLVLSNKEKTIEILSSDDEVQQNKENISQPPSSSSLSSSGATRKQQSLSKMMQPTIQSSIKQQEQTSKAKDVKFVSKKFYEKELSNLQILKMEYSRAEKLLETIANDLPDGGLQLRRRIKLLENDIQMKNQYINSLKIIDELHGDVPPPKTGGERKPAFLNADGPDWDDLSAAVNQVQPKFTGAIGMAKFNAEKVLTVDRLKDLHGSLENRPGENVLAEDPQGLKVTLMDHQKHALAWMEWREKQKPRGGILADDMGLGKTLTMISLVLACKNRSQEEHDKDAKESSDESDEDDKKSTWSTKGRRDYYNGGTLVICPASLIRQWENEVQSKLSRHKVTVCVHHGNNRDTKAKNIRTYDMVVTTYQIVSREHKTMGALFGMKWRRIILDEAHVIRNHKAQSSIAVCDLRAKYRWTLTGTPIQNKEMDVYALLKFLRCTPFDDLNHWKKWIDNKSAGGQQRLNMLMKSLMLRRTKAQLQDCGKLDTLPKRDVRLIEVALDKDEMNVYQKIMTYSRTLFAQFLFQRAERNTDLMYREQGNRPTFMQSKDPNGAYYKMHQKFSRLHHGSKEIKSHEILTLLLRLRQICCHPCLIDAMLEDEGERSVHKDDSDYEEPEIDLLEQLNKLAIKDTSTTSNNSKTHNGSKEANEEPLCAEDQEMAKASARVLQRSNPVFNSKRPSSKMLKIMDTLRKHVLKTSDKAIIVSQWTSVLGLLKLHLHNEGVETLTLDGTVPVKNRQTIVNKFNDQQDSVKILLLSLTAGGVGLNLIGANHLLLIDLHWNPQTEAQAQDRIYRVGQKKNVTIYKFMCIDTVEQRIKALQDHKIELANGVLTGVKTNEGSKLTMDDLKGLFGL